MRQLTRHQAAKGQQRAALKALAPLLGGNAAARVAEAKRCFAALDLDKDGYISLPELTAGLRQLAPAGLAGTDMRSAAELFAEIDCGGGGEGGAEPDGCIDLEEWLMAAVSLSLCLSASLSGSVWLCLALSLYLSAAHTQGRRWSRKSSRGVKIAPTSLLCLTQTATVAWTLKSSLICCYRKTEKERQREVDRQRQRHAKAVGMLCVPGRGKASRWMS